jgi:hypothetical protein
LARAGHHGTGLATHDLTATTDYYDLTATTDYHDLTATTDYHHESPPSAVSADGLVGDGHVHELLHWSPDNARVDGQHFVVGHRLRDPAQLERLGLFRHRRPRGRDDYVLRLL